MIQIIFIKDVGMEQKKRFSEYLRKYSYN